MAMTPDERSRVAVKKAAKAATTDPDYYKKRKLIGLLKKIARDSLLKNPNAALEACKAIARLEGWEVDSKSTVIKTSKEEPVEFNNDALASLLGTLKDKDED